MIDGVYTFANGFRECVAMQPAAVAGPGIQIDSQPANRGPYACRFHWDAEAGMLRQEPGDP